MATAAAVAMAAAMAMVMAMAMATAVATHNLSVDYTISKAGEIFLLLFKWTTKLV